MLNTIASRLFFYKLVLASWVSGFFLSKVYKYFLKYLCIRKKRIKKNLSIKKKIFFKGVVSGVNLENINKFKLLWKNIFIVKQLLEQQSSGKILKEDIVNAKKEYVENV